MSLPVMRTDGEKRLKRRDVAMWMEEIGVFWSAGTRNSVIAGPLASVTEPVELVAWFQSKNNWRWTRVRDKNERLGIIDGIPMKTLQGCVAAGYIQFTNELHRTRTMKIFKQCMHSSPIWLWTKILQNDRRQDVRCARWRRYWNNNNYKPYCLVVRWCTLA